jgi:hypothetical protein
LVFTSSIAVFGAPFPDAIDDEFHTPLTSYAGRRASANCCSRTTPARVVSTASASACRPSACGRARRQGASGFFSNIIPEPLASKEAVLPVQESVMHDVRAN